MVVMSTRKSFHDNTSFGLHWAVLCISALCLSLCGALGRGCEAAADVSQSSENPAQTTGTDAVHDWMERRFSEIAEVFGKHDSDHDGRLPCKEWPAAQLIDVSGELAALPGKAWDQDGDGEIVLDECRHVLEVAYGIRRQDGALLRELNGAVVDYIYISSADKNKDGFLSVEEFVGTYWAGGPEKNADVFRQLDKDQDQRLSYLEIAANPALNATLDHLFAARDKNSDGYLDREELDSTGHEWQRSLASRVIPVFDDDHDGRLSPYEFGATPLANLSTDFYVLRKDADGDQTLSWPEFYTEKTPFAVELSREYFRRFDRDKNGSLGLDELDFIISAPHGDAIRGWFDKRLSQVAEVFRATDTDEDGKLSRSEWPVAQLKGVSGELAALPGKAWDQDGDGAIVLDECRRVLEVAYGIRRQDGALLRDPGGAGVNYIYIRSADKNNDGFLSFEEFVGSYWAGGREKNAAVFRQADNDQDDRLSFSEIVANPAFSATLEQLFAARDKNSDGYIDRDELNTTGHEWERSLASRMVPQFDDDRDGRLSPYEFGATPLANLSSDFCLQRKDKDDDGTLSWPEFYTDKSPFTIELSREYFRRFDRDQNGSLSFDELEFIVDTNKIPTEVAFKIRDQDRDGQLALEEVFSEKKPADVSALALERYEMRLADAEGRFLSADANGDGSLDLNEFTLARQAAMEIAKRHSEVLSRRDRVMGGSFWLRKGAFIVNEIAILYGAWLVLRRKTERGSNS